MLQKLILIKIKNVKLSKSVVQKQLKYKHLTSHWHKYRQSSKLRTTGISNSLIAIVPSIKKLKIEIKKATFQQNNCTHHKLYVEQHLKV